MEKDKVQSFKSEDRNEMMDDIMKFNADEEEMDVLTIIDQNERKH